MENPDVQLKHLESGCIQLIVELICLELLLKAGYEKTSKFSILLTLAL